MTINDIIDVIPIVASARTDSGLVRQSFNYVFL